MKRIRDQNGAPALVIYLAPNAARWLAETTEMNLGKRLMISLCGEEIIAPLVLERVASGALMLSGHLKADELGVAAHIIAGQVGCDGTWNGPGVPQQEKTPRRTGTRGG